MVKATSRRAKHKYNIEDSTKTIRNAVTVKLITRMGFLIQEIFRITIDMASVSFSKTVK